MANRSTDSTLARDDHGVAAVVGFVLILAVGITYYSYSAQSQVPAIGAANEQDWNAEIGDALIRLASAASGGAGTDTSASEILPPAPEAPSQTVMFLAPLRSVRASGSIAFDPSCASATMGHVTGAGPVTDLVDGARGCLTFRADTAYSESFAYQIELGGVLRMQDDKAVVLAGPPLEVSTSRIGITLIDMRGASQTLGVSSDAPVTLSPRPGALEVTSQLNTNSVSWTLTTDHPEAWRNWYEDRFVSAGVPLTSTITCTTPGAIGPARGPCDVELTLTTPTSLSISYGRYDVTLG